MRLVVGLGNPGSEFVATRHNVGWEAVDELAFRLGWIRRKDEFNRLGKSKFEGLMLDGSVSIHSGGSEKLLLLKPTTFMNDSGRSVQAAMAFYQLSPMDLMVVLDDLALPCGKIRIRPGGSSGGHNGLKDIGRALGTDEYPRLRIGIDSRRREFRDGIMSWAGSRTNNAKPSIRRSTARHRRFCDGLKVESKRR